MSTQEPHGPLGTAGSARQDGSFGLRGAHRLVPDGSPPLTGPRRSAGAGLTFWVFRKRFCTQRPGRDPALKCSKGDVADHHWPLRESRPYPYRRLWRLEGPADVKEKGDLSKIESMHICDTKFLSPTDIPSQSLRVLRSSRGARPAGSLQGPPAHVPPL